MKHKTKQKHQKKSTQREDGDSWSTRRSRAVDKMLKKQFIKAKRNGELDSLE